MRHPDNFLASCLVMAALGAVLLILAVLTQGCSPIRAPVPVPEKALEAEVVILRSKVKVDPGWDGTEVSLNYYPACGGVAVGPHEIITAKHCLRGMLQNDAVPYVDRPMWDMTSSGKRWAKVLGFGPGDLAHLLTDQTMSYLTPARDEPEEVIGLRLFEGRRMTWDKGRIGGDLKPGDSGSPLVTEEGDLVGLIVSCDLEDGHCLDRGDAVPVLP